MSEEIFRAKFARKQNRSRRQDSRRQDRGRASQGGQGRSEAAGRGNDFAATLAAALTDTQPETPPDIETGAGKVRAEAQARARAKTRAETRSKFRRERTGLLRRRSASSKSLGSYPEIIIGLILVVGGAVFILGFSSSGTKGGVEIAVLALDIRKGEALGPEHLGIAKISTENSVRFLTPSSARNLLDQAALLNLPAEAPLLKEHFSQSPAISSGQLLAGIRLSAGEYPTPHLKAGQLVDIVRLSGEDSQSIRNSQGSQDSQSQGPSILLQNVEIYSVYSLSEGAGSDIFVTLIIPDFAALDFSAASDTRNLKLFLSPAR